MTELRGLKHLTCRQLKQLLECRGVDHTHYTNPKRPMGRLNKDDLIWLVHHKSDPTIKNPLCPGTGGQYGGIATARNSSVSDLMGVELADCEFAGTPQEVKGVDRLWSTAIGFDSSVNRPSIVFLSGKEDTMIAQNLGNSDAVVELWKTGIEHFAKAPMIRFAAVEDGIRIEPPEFVQDPTICKAKDGTHIAVTILKHRWHISLRSLFEYLDMKDKDLVVPLTVGPAIERITGEDTEAGKSPLHYMWRFEIDKKGREWLIISIIPLAYFYGPDTHPIVVDRLIRAALYDYLMS